MDIEYNYDDSQKHANYCVLLRTVEFAKNNGRITEDWMEEHKSLIMQYREWIADYSRVNEEIQEASFRKTCYDTETLISCLVSSIKATGSFDPKIYIMLVKHLIKICDATFAEDDLNACLEMMKI
jgi:hypothetical protein